MTSPIARLRSHLPRAADPAWLAIWLAIRVSLAALRAALATIAVDRTSDAELALRPQSHARHSFEYRVDRQEAS